MITMVTIATARNTNELKGLKQKKTLSPSGMKKLAMKIVFLDIDGVLVTRDSPRPLREIPISSCVQALQRIIDTVQPQIVVSSSWRLDVSGIEGMRDLLTNFGLVNFNLLGMTPFISGANVTRGDEIRAWLKTTDADVEVFAIIDDDKQMGDLLPFWFKTTWANGLTDEIADKVIWFLTNSRK